MMVVHDVRKPFAIEHAIHVLRLGLRVGVEIAIVVVADVLLIEPRQPVQRPLLFILFLHVPVGDEVHAVGIGVDEENDDVVENSQRLGVVGGEDLIDRLHQHLGA